MPQVCQKYAENSLGIRQATPVTVGRIFSRVSGSVGFPATISQQRALWLISAPFVAACEHDDPMQRSERESKRTNLVSEQPEYQSSQVQSP